MHEATEYIDIF